MTHTVIVVWCDTCDSGLQDPCGQGVGEPTVEHSTLADQSPNWDLNETPPKATNADHLSNLDWGECVTNTYK